MRLIGPTGSKVHGDLSREPRSEAPMSLAVEPRGGWESCFPGSLRGREPGGLQTGALFSAWSQTQGRSCDFSQLLNFSILRWFGFLHLLSPVASTGRSAHCFFLQNHVGCVGCPKAIWAMPLPLGQASCVPVLQMSSRGLLQHLGSSLPVLCSNKVLSRVCLDPLWLSSPPHGPRTPGSREAGNSCLAPPLFLPCSCWGSTSVHPARESPSNFFVTRSHCKLLSKCCLASSCSRHLPPT